ncbi:hypothetical protein GW17_00013506 [Ensete ventricosum]|nr:hypothetical protein GW17_00013506 [Ensete ventricosum]
MLTLIPRSNISFLDRPATILVFLVTGQVSTRNSAQDAPTSKPVCNRQGTGGRKARRSKMAPHRVIPRPTFGILKKKSEQARAINPKVAINSPQFHLDRNFPSDSGKGVPQDAQPDEDPLGGTRLEAVLSLPL